MLNYFRLFILVLLSVSASAQLPIVTIVTSNTAFCTGHPITFSASATGPVESYSWSVFPTKDVKISATNRNSFTATFPKDLTYTISLVSETTLGTVKSRKLIAVALTARAAFNASLNAAGAPNQLVLTNYSSYSKKNYWLFSDVADRDSSTNTVKSYDAPGSYSVGLIALGTRGCNDTSHYHFSIEDKSSLTLPNIFSPNGDGINEVYKPIGEGIASMKGYVFTREGIILFQWSTPQGFWDGRTISGEACQDGEYGVVVEATGFDGKTYNLKTMVTLIR